MRFFEEPEGAENCLPALGSLIGTERRALECLVACRRWDCHKGTQRGVRAQAERLGLNQPEEERPIAPQGAAGASARVMLLCPRRTEAGLLVGKCTRGHPVCAVVIPDGAVKAVGTGARDH
jgi:hypothetical protein